MVAGERGVYAIALHEDDSWDVDQFLTLARSALDEGAGGPDLARLLAAEAAHAGPLYPEWSDAPWAAGRRAEVEDAYCAVLDRLAERLLAAGRPADAAARYRRLTELRPELEAGHRGLIEAYATSGERALALRQYQACRTLLRRRLGAEPSPETRALYEALVSDRLAPAGRPDTRGAPEGTVTIVFTDIEGSAALARRLGDRRWMTVLGRHEQLIRRAAAAHGGHEVKHQGDGLMLAFASARGAIDFAIAVQRALEADRRRHPDEALCVRIGMHTGEALRRGEDFFGQAVNLAARVAGACAGDQIAVSDLVRQLTESAGDLHFAGERTVELKGIAGPHRIHLVDWRAAS